MIRTNLMWQRKRTNSIRIRNVHEIELLLLRAIRINEHVYPANYPILRPLSQSFENLFWTMIIIYLRWLLSNYWAFVVIFPMCTIGQLKISFNFSISRAMNMPALFLLNITSMEINCTNLNVKKFFEYQHWKLANLWSYGISLNKYNEIIRCHLLVQNNCVSFSLFLYVCCLK